MKDIASPPEAPSLGPTVEEFAEIIHYHPESVRRKIRDGDIKALVFGRTYRILPTEVTRILSEGLPA